MHPRRKSRARIPGVVTIGIRASPAILHRRMWFTHIQTAGALVPITNFIVVIGLRRNTVTTTMWWTTGTGMA